MEVLSYIYKVTLCLAACYGFYFLLLKEEKAFRFNRFYLLFSTIFAVIAPLLTIDMTAYGIGPVKEAVTYAYTTTTSVLSTPESVSSIDGWAIAFKTLWIIYAAVAGLLLIRFIINLISIVRNIRKGKKINVSKLYLVLNQKEIRPHTFLKFIFLNKKDYELGRIGSEVLEHEKAHVDQWHTIDILLIESCKIFLWFIPFIWLIKKDIQLNHEYLADEAVLKNTSVIEYQTSIVRAIQQTKALGLTSNFDFNSTKKRFTMMTKTKLKQWPLAVRMGLFIPMILGLFLYSVNLQAQEKPSEEKEIKKEIKVITSDKADAEMKEENKKVIKMQFKTEGKELSKEEVEKIKKDLRETLEKQESLSEKEMKLIEEKLDKLDEEIEFIIKEGESSEPKIMFFDEKGEKGEKVIKIIEKDIDEKIEWESSNGQKIKIIEKKLDGGDNKQVIVIKKIGDAEVEVIELEKEMEDLEFHMKDIEIDLKDMKKKIEKKVKVIVNGMDIDIDEDFDLDNLDEMIQEKIKIIHLDEDDIDVDVDKKVQVIKIITEEEGKKSKKKKK